MVYQEIEQAIYRGSGPGRYTLRARSPGFRDDWLPRAEQLCDGFGERPEGVACPGAVYAQPFGKRLVSVVQVADQPGGDLGFHLVVIDRLTYFYALGGNPFQLADQCPPPWEVSDFLLPLEWPDGESISPRTIADVRRVLQRDDGPNLLGGAQALVDGGRLVFERAAPDSGLLRDLWVLLPTSTRADLWPATFAFGNALGFHAVVVPPAVRKQLTNYLTEEQAGEYPEGRYELSLQTAAEVDDQRELDRLFARRSRQETFRLGLLILAASVIVLLVVSLINAPARRPVPPPPPAKAVKDSP